MFGIALVFVLITVVGLLGNVLVLMVIALNPQMHDRSVNKQTNNQTRPHNLDGFWGHDNGEWITI